MTRFSLWEILLPSLFIVSKPKSYGGSIGGGGSAGFVVPKPKEYGGVILGVGEKKPSTPSVQVPAPVPTPKPTPIPVVRETVKPPSFLGDERGLQPYQIEEELRRKRLRQLGQYGAPEGSLTERGRIQRSEIEAIRQQGGLTILTPQTSSLYGSVGLTPRESARLGAKAEQMRQATEKRMQREIQQAQREIGIGQTGLARDVGVAQLKARGILGARGDPRTEAAIEALSRISPIPQRIVSVQEQKRALDISNLSDSFAPVGYGAGEVPSPYIGSPQQEFPTEAPPISSIVDLESGFGAKIPKTKEYGGEILGVGEKGTATLVGGIAREQIGRVRVIQAGQPTYEGSMVDYQKALDELQKLKIVIPIGAYEKETGIGGTETFRRKYEDAIKQAMLIGTTLPTEGLTKEQIDEQQKRENFLESLSKKTVLRQFEVGVVSGKKTGSFEAGITSAQRALIPTYVKTTPKGVIVKYGGADPFADLDKALLGLTTAQIGKAQLQIERPSKKQVKLESEEYQKYLGFAGKIKPTFAGGELEYASSFSPFKKWYEEEQKKGMGFKRISELLIGAQATSITLAGAKEIKTGVALLSTPETAPAGAGLIALGTTSIFVSPLVEYGEKYLEPYGFTPRKEFKETFVNLADTLIETLDVYGKHLPTPKRVGVKDISYKGTILDFSWMKPTKPTTDDFITKYWKQSILPQLKTSFEKEIMIPTKTEHPKTVQYLSDVGMVTKTLLEQPTPMDAGLFFTRGALETSKFVIEHPAESAGYQVLFETLIPTGLTRFAKDTGKLADLSKATIGTGAISGTLVKASTIGFSPYTKKTIEYGTLGLILAQQEEQIYARLQSEKEGGFKTIEEKTHARVKAISEAAGGLVGFILTQKTGEKFGGIPLRFVTGELLTGRGGGGFNRLLLGEGGRVNVNKMPVVARQELAQLLDKGSASIEFVGTITGAKRKSLMQLEGLSGEEKIKRLQEQKIPFVIDYTIAGAGDDRLKFQEWFRYASPNLLDTFYLQKYVPEARIKTLHSAIKEYQRTGIVKFELKEALTDLLKTKNPDKIRIAEDIYAKLNFARTQNVLQALGEKGIKDLQVLRKKAGTLSQPEYVGIEKTIDAKTKFGYELAQKYGLVIQGGRALQIAFGEAALKAMGRKTSDIDTLLLGKTKEEAEVIAKQLLKDIIKKYGKHYRVSRSRNLNVFKIEDIRTGDSYIEITAEKSQMPLFGEVKPIKIKGVKGGELRVVDINQMFRGLIGEAGKSFGKLQAPAGLKGATKTLGDLSLVLKHTLGEQFGKKQIGEPFKNLRGVLEESGLLFKQRITPESFGEKTVKDLKSIEKKLYLEQKSSATTKGFQKLLSSEISNLYRGLDVNTFGIAQIIPKEEILPIREVKVTRKKGESLEIYRKRVVMATEKALETQQLAMGTRIRALGKGEAEVVTKADTYRIPTYGEDVKGVAKVFQQFLFGEQFFIDKQTGMPVIIQRESFVRREPPTSKEAMGILKKRVVQRFKNLGSELTLGLLEAGSPELAKPKVGKVVIPELQAQKNQLGTQLKELYSSLTKQGFGKKGMVSLGVGKKKEKIKQFGLPVVGVSKEDKRFVRRFGLDSLEGYSKKEKRVLGKDYSDYQKRLELENKRFRERLEKSAKEEPRKVRVERDYFNLKDLLRVRGKDRLFDRDLSRVIERVPERFRERIVERPRERVPERPRERVPERLRERVPERFRERIVERPRERVPERPRERVPEVPRVPERFFGGKGAFNLLDEINKIEKGRRGRTRFAGSLTGLVFGGGIKPTKGKIAGLEIRGFAPIRKRKVFEVEDFFGKTGFMKGRKPARDLVKGFARLGKRLNTVFGGKVEKKGVGITETFK